MKKKSLIVIAALLVITAITTCIYLNSRSKTAEGDILLVSSGKEVTVHFNDLPLTDVSGETINKKGETKTIEGKGFPLSGIPSLAGVSDYSEMTVYADDEYNTSISKEELSGDDNAFLIEDEKGIRMVVFGGPADRAVKNVVRIEIN
ncbi:MAG: hypothetical protein IJI51_03915 [Lachnospiraceae bacterium]|nr:hypothetical protein [Lachnospiraceae bacterium]